MPSKEKYWGDLIREMYQALKKRLPTSEEMNEAYWKLRTDEIDKTVAKLQKEVYKEMAQAYVETFREIAKETNDFLMKYATDNKLDLATVNQLITPVELSEYTEKMEQLRAMYRDTKSEYILREIKELEARMTITRFQALQDSINIELCKITHEFQMTLEDTLIGLFTEQYKEASEMLGIMNPTIPTEAIKKSLNILIMGKCLQTVCGTIKRIY